MALSGLARLGRFPDDAYRGVPGGLGPEAPVSHPPRVTARCPYATADIHRATAGRRLFHAATGGEGHRGTRLRRVLPVRPLPEDGSGQRAAWSHGRLDNAVRPRRADGADPAWRARVARDVLLAWAAGRQRRPGRPDERWPGRARARNRLVRRRTRCVRDTVSSAWRPVLDA